MPLTAVDLGQDVQVAEWNKGGNKAFPHTTFPQRHEAPGLLSLLLLRATMLLVHE